MKKALLVALTGLTAAISPVCALQRLSLSGPTTWTPGTSIVLQTTDTYLGFGGGSWGLSYFFEVESTIDPFLLVSGLSFFTFPNGNYTGPFPARLTTIDCGATSPTLVPDTDGSTVTDITIALPANAPAGTYTLRTTTASPRGSFQITSDFGDAPFPEATFVFTVIPEPSTLALIGLVGFAAGLMAYRRRK